MSQPKAPASSARDGVHQGEGPGDRGVARSLTGAAGRAIGRLFDVVGSVRGGRPLHPVGAVLHARLVRDGASSGVAWIDEPGDDRVVVRLSRGGGLPPLLPDVQGLALRHGDTDVLLSSALLARVVRHVPFPVPAPGRIGYCSIMPFDAGGRPLLLAARPVPPRRLPGAPRRVAGVLAQAPLQLELLWARPLGRWTRFGQLELHGPVGPGTDAPLRFDPRRTPDGLAVPGWIARLRAPSYEAARRHPAAGARHPGAPPPTSDLARPLA